MSALKLKLTSRDDGAMPERFPATTKFSRCEGEGEHCSWHDCSPYAPCLEKSCPHCEGSGYAFP